MTRLCVEINLTIHHHHHHVGTADSHSIPLQFFCLHLVPLSSDNTATIFCQPERGSLIAIDTSSTRQVMWLHTHRHVTVKLGLRVVLLQGRGQIWQCHLTHTRQADQSPGRGAHRAQRAAPRTERTQWAFSSHLPIRHSPSSTLKLCCTKLKAITIKRHKFFMTMLVRFNTSLYLVDYKDFKTSA